MKTVSIQELVDSGVHFGCRVSRWNPKMSPYIYGRRNKIHVIDLKETMRGILRARNLLYHLAAEGQSILWVGTKRQVKGVISDAGERTGMPTVTERWIGGTLTNFSVIRSRLRRLEELERIEEDGTINSHPKKIIAKFRRDRRKINRNLGGIREMTSIPGAMVVVDPGREYNAVREARKMGLVIIGLLDTDCDPSAVDIIIPGNDDALKSVRLLISQLESAVEEGSANAREQRASVGDAEKHDKAVEGEVRPTRPIRPMPDTVKNDRSDKPAAPAAEAKPAADTKAEATPEAPKETAPEASKDATPEKVTAKPASDETAS